MEKYDYRFRIVTIGNSNVGKSCAIQKYVNNSYNCDNHLSTVGVDFVTKNVKINDKSMINRNINLQIWDTCGQERFLSLTSAYFRNCDGIIIMYDISNRESFNKINYWLKEKTKNRTKPPCRVLLVLVPVRLIPVYYN